MKRATRVRLLSALVTLTLLISVAFSVPVFASEMGTQSASSNKETTEVTKNADTQESSGKNVDDKVVDKENAVSKDAAAKSLEKSTPEVKKSADEKEAEAVDKDTEALVNKQGALEEGIALQGQPENGLRSLPAPSPSLGVFVFRPADATDASEDLGFATLGEASDAFNNTLDQGKSYDLFLTGDYTIVQGEKRVFSLNNRSLEFKSFEGQGPFTLFSDKNHTRNLKIDGPGNFVTKNIILDGRKYGGGLEIFQSVHYIADAGTIIQNSSFGSWHKDGAVRIVGSTNDDNTKLTVNEGAQFINNEAVASNGAGGGGAISTKNNVVININGATFTGNTANDDGGALKIFDNQCPVQITNSVFTNNTINGRRGGAISYFNRHSSAGTLAINNCEFENNKTLDKERTGSQGGAVSILSGSEKSDAVQVTDCTFKNNSSYLGGGALSILHAQSPVISGCTFESNKCLVSERTDGKHGKGGAILLDPTVDSAAIKNCTFVGNHASRGGAIDSEARNTTLISGSSFTNNSVSLEGNGNYQRGVGGAIAFGCDTNQSSKSQILNVTGCTFEGNTAPYQTSPNQVAGKGGAIYYGQFAYQIQSITDTSFTGNTSQDGGALYVEKRKSAALSSIRTKGATTFTGNQAANGANGNGHGGAIYASNDLQISNAKEAVYSKNKAFDGGAIYGDSNLKVDCGTFESNHADNYGGAIFGNRVTEINQNNNSKYGLTFTKNSANNNGGAINSKGDLTVNKSTFTENSVNNLGGAIATTGKVTAKGNDFSKNEARLGGAIYTFETSSALSVSDSKFDQNSASSSGGAIYTSSVNSTLSNTSFTRNDAPITGGAIYAISSGQGTLTAENHCTFEKSSSNTGGAIYSYKVTTNADNCTFAENQAVSGGALFLDNCATDISTMFKTTFSKNSSYNGGAICSAGSNLSLAKSNFDANIAKTYTADYGYGGAIFALANNENNLKIIGSKFTGNTAEFSAGAIYLGPGMKADITEKSAFTNNTAKRLAGAIYVNPGSTDPTVNTTDYEQLTTDETTTFSGNKSSAWYLFPENKDDLTNLKFASVSEGPLALPANMKPHILNDYDVNYMGRLLISYNAGKLADLPDFKEAATYGEGRVLSEDYTIADPSTMKFTSDKLKFKGWNTSADGTGDSYEPSDSYELLDNLQLYAMWDFIVEFDADGGTPAPEAQEVAEGAKATEPTAPTKTGYTFDGWYDGDTKYDFNSPVTAPLTLTAHWTINTFEVTFDSAGGSAVESQAVNYNEKASEPTAPTKEGYTFAGWFNGNQEYDFTKPVTDNLALTAHWTLNTYQVTFDAAGGTPVPENETVSHGNQVTKPADPAKEGYRFDGWFNGNEEYDFTQAVTGNLELTAHWTQMHQITFDADGGTPAPDAQEVADGTKATEPTAPTKEGYTFAGWYDGDKKFDFDDAVTAPVALKAHWTINTFEVTFDSNGGSAVESQTVNYNEKASEPAAPTKDGYRFDGWFNGNKEFDFDTPITASLMLQAHWIKLHKVTFDADGGTPVPDAQEVDEGAKATEPTVPTKEGYTFAGWYDGDDKYDFDTPVFAPVALKAHWTLNTYEVTFNTMNGIPQPENQTVAYGDTVNEPVSPTKKGYRFDGWFIGGEKYDFTKPVTENLQIVAHWTQLYNVTFDVDGGTPSPEAQVVAHGDKASEPAAPTKEGFKALGWYVGDTKYDFSTPVTDDLTLTMKWEKVDQPVTPKDPKPAPITVDKGETPDPADGISNKDELPEGTKYEFDKPVETDTPGEKEVTIIVTYPDGTQKKVDTTVTVKDPSTPDEPKTDADNHDPKPAPITVDKDKTPDPADGISNKDKLPEGTKFEFDQPVDTSKPGEFKVTIIVTYPDGSKDQVETTVTVKQPTAPVTPDKPDHPSGTTQHSDDGQSAAPVTYVTGYKIPKTNDLSVMLPVALLLLGAGVAFTLRKVAISKK